MIRHVVAWRLSATDPQQKRADGEAMKSKLEALVGVVPTLKALHVGLDIDVYESNWDAVLVADYDSPEDLEAYQVHPAHQTVSAFVRSVTSERAAVDFELP